MGTIVKTWADHLEPIGYGGAIPVRSSDSMNREYPLQPGGTGYSYWWTASDGSMLFYPFGRATGLYNGSSYTPQSYHFMWINDYPDPLDPPYTTQLVFALFYMDDRDMGQMVGETVTTTGTSIIIDPSAQLAPGPGVPGGQPIASTVGLISTVGKLTAVT